MADGGSQQTRFGLPEYGRDEFDERALEDAIRSNRRNELARTRSGSSPPVTVAMAQNETAGPRGPSPSRPVLGPGSVGSADEVTAG